MIKDEPISRVVTYEIIKSGHLTFDKYLNDTVAKKNDKRRKPNTEQIQKNTDYSTVNLIKIQRVRLPSTQLLASELLKANYTIHQDENQPEDDLKYQEDFQAAQQLNDKLIKRFTRPVKKELEKKLGWMGNVSPFDLFRKRAENIVGHEVDKRLQRVDGRNRLKAKLQTSKQMLQNLDQTMLYLPSSLQAHFRQQQFHSQLKQSNLLLIHDLCSHYKHILTSDGVSTSHKPHNQSSAFTSLIQSLLPSYLQPQEYRQYTPIPWKTNQIEKQLARTSFQQITGKVLYQYEHKILDVKEHFLKGKIYEIEKKGTTEIEKYLKENLYVKKETKTEDIDAKGTKNLKNNNQNKNESSFFHNMGFQKEKIKKKQSHHQSKEKQCIVQNLISNNLVIQKINKNPSKQQNYELPTPNLDKALKNQPKNQQKSYNSNIVQNFINIKTKAPQSSLLSHNQRYDNLDQYKFSKHDQFLQISHKIQQKSNIKQNQQNQTTRNIIFQKQQSQQSPHRRKSLETRNSKALGLVKNINFQSDRLSSDEQSSSSEESNFFDTMTQYKQKKTTKKKKSFLKKTPPQSSSFGEIKIKQSRNVVLSKKGQLIKFYPMKIGSLILQRKNHAYLEYNSAKQQLKNLTIKFLIDRIKHGINDVEIIVPSFGHHNIASMKVNDQQKAKQIIKIISSLGGNIQKIKTRSGYDDKQSAHENTNRPKISTEIQIYKFFYKQMSYYEIIDALNLEKQWLQSQKDNRKLGGWKY